jgi:hypothetical protein
MSAPSLQSLDLSKLSYLFYYKGNYSEGPGIFITNILENNVKRSDNQGQLKRVMFLVIEALQNIERYSFSKEDPEDFSLVMRDKDFYYVYTENLINDKKAKELTERLDSLKKQNSEELTETYFNQLDSGGETEKGAGLGLIEIARKTNNRIFYGVREKGENTFVYNLCFALPIGRDKEDAKPDFEFIQQISQTLTIQFKNDKRALLYNGDFSNAFLKTLLGMLKIMKDHAKTLSRLTHHILIELIQNINKHGLRVNESVDAKLLIEWCEEGLKISTRNNISTENSLKFGQKVDLLNSADKAGLERLNQSQLLDLEANNGLGLIDVANLIYPQKIGYASSPKENGSSELFLSILIENG